MIGEFDSVSAIKFILIGSLLIYILLDIATMLFILDITSKQDSVRIKKLIMLVWIICLFLLGLNQFGFKIR